MSQAWYIKHKGKTVGPITSAKLRQLVDNGRVLADARLRLGDEGKWVRAANVKGLFADRKAKSRGVETAQPQSKAPSSSQVSDEPASPTKTPPPATLERASSSSPYQSPIPLDETVVASSPAKDENSIGFRRALLTLWFQPRRTIRWAIDHRPGRDAILLVAVAFALKFLDNSISDGSYPVGMMLVGSLFGMPVSAAIGLLLLYLVSFSNTIIGASLGGCGDARSLRIAFAWSTVPTIVAFPITLLFVILIHSFPKTLFLPEFVINAPFLMLSVWSIVIHIAGISAAHDLPVWRAVVTLTLTAIIYGLTFAIVIVASLMLFT